MKLYFFVLSLCFGYTYALAQTDSSWFMFTDTSTDLIGYKNSKGKIMIEPKFTHITQQKIFKHIMPVYEKNEGPANGTTNYYLLKNGKKIGEDSLYIGEYFLDCETENKIRFRDHLTDKVGFFNGNGQVIIPAIYDDATSFTNGFALTISNGKRICADGEEYKKNNPCPEWSWVGTTQLINKHNQVLIDKVDGKDFEYIDFFSVQLNPKVRRDDFVEFKSSNNATYAFRDFKKEFEHWLHSDFSKNKSLKDLSAHIFQEITFPKEGKIKSREITNPKFTNYTWVVDEGEKILNDNKSYIQHIISMVNSDNNRAIISNSSGPLFLDKEKYQAYFSDCGDYLQKRFPYFEVIITNTQGLELHRLGFIRSSQGYKLLEIM